MTPAQALRFAKTLVKDNCHLRRFDVEVEDDVVQPLRDALAELGYDVQVDPTRPRLHITCPEAEKEA
jgi:hypothetical protein